MCGRFSFHSPHELMRQLFGLDTLEPGTADLPPRWNIAPGSLVGAVRTTVQRQRGLARLQWGLVPSWARDRDIGDRLVNARIETARDKPSFRSAFRRRRCLVVADAYYEWRAEGRGKQPYLIEAVDAQPFGMAGLWESWRDPANGEVLESCVIVTRPSAAAVREVHDRMPGLVAAADYPQWLDPGYDDVAALAELILAEPKVPLRIRPVSRRVNNPRNEGPELAAPAVPGGD